MTGTERRPSPRLERAEGGRPRVGLSPSFTESLFRAVAAGGLSPVSGQPAFPGFPFHLGHTVSAVG